MIRFAYKRMYVINIYVYVIYSILFYSVLYFICMLRAPLQNSWITNEEMKIDFTNATTSDAMEQKKEWKKVCMELTLGTSAMCVCGIFWIFLIRKRNKICMDLIASIYVMSCQGNWYLYPIRPFSKFSQIFSFFFNFWSDKC